jgi:hypothetical protein
MRREIVHVALGLVAVLSGCGGSGYGSSMSAPVTCAGGTPVALTVKNYLSWCSVSLAGQAASSASAQTVCVAAGPVSVSATALAGFELGPAPWHDTAGDHGAGDPGTVTGTGQSASSATTVTAAGSATCAWVCCPFTGGTGCPAANQCP